MVKSNKGSVTSGSLKSPASLMTTSKPDKDKDEDKGKKDLKGSGVMKSKSDTMKKLLSTSDLKRLKAAKAAGGEQWEREKAKIRLKLAPSEHKSKSARANTAMPVNKLKRRIIESVPKGNRVTTEAAIALAAVMDYAVSELVDCAAQACELKQQRTITPRHIKLGVPQDESLADLFKGVTIPQGGTVPTFHPELAQGYKQQKRRKEPTDDKYGQSSPAYGEKSPGGSDMGKKDFTEKKPSSSGYFSSGKDAVKDKPGGFSSSPAEK